MIDAHSLEPRDPLGRALAGSLITHGVFIGLALLSGYWNFNGPKWGSEHASSGSVGVGIVQTVPIARRVGVDNVLAADTESVVPQAPAEVKMKSQVEVPDPKAIEIPTKKIDKRKPSPKPVSKSAYRPPDAYKPNTVAAYTPQAANSKMFGTSGSGGIDIGPASVLGDRFGAYVDLMRQRIAQHWNTADVQTNQKCAVSFTIGRDGSVTNVQLSHPSGNYLLDTSAKRAILEANPLPPLPQQFDRSQATVELWFQLNK